MAGTIAVARRRRNRNRALAPAVYGRTAAASAKSAIAQPTLSELRDKADEDVRALWTLLAQRLTRRDGCLSVSTTAHPHVVE
ncbi:hypothetical protein Msi02_75830 [Microbispora siamensis]|uniref:Uncharacterized protein n=1 Tax=Microbispora siamensis TaxID=564413 RepID=A0ABQ4GZC6_9ACTN|nr:hypothetical protein Msi02_75830 [Microbispora siamensis]